MFTWDQVLSYNDINHEIKHLLLKYQVGIGRKYTNIWFPAFLDCLEYTLKSNNLPYSKHI